MIKVIEAFDDDFLEDYLLREIGFTAGFHNSILFYDYVVKDRLFKFILEYFNKNSIYIISGFNMKPYLNITENIYDILNIDLDMDSCNNSIFDMYCNILDFKMINRQFHFLTYMDKLKSMIITSLLSKNKVIVFDWTYSDDVIKCAEELMDKINTLGLFSDRVFIEFKKAS
ncbi:hypothetical protein SFBM_0435 [Candidatus Arthromitus sp. SFB-mouse-Japan]|jgi:hypothetical protein|uniref:hypothetical protein n=1 Tax=unclassified Candidatus Neoarthromitus TaxID=2638829 RepID=UPI00021B7E8E|nr:MULTISPECIES: hypothetical protein [unclassified Candidatus Arthromitus]EIA21924.1 hypothetical protein SFB3_405G0 [Candidatus Arthromitus sp. SFB-3]EIA23073.1 hypothetical protein SFB1_214G1 [Candidatus Arthromitus sp. SFB-1]EIA25877.1 hypothetical protein SFB4_288G1 [Candidatus Arthromitus sp. SFB-4]EIA27824.1 hypothetical protein SFB6_086G6 [Candidatus Arthromitus sp. SFB-co]EIA30483.1 hypothetical protein SFBSU_006G164 [Candidatus Arthromitus sp. SFB-mouse-SU]EIA31718.1 hypothetical pr